MFFAPLQKSDVAGLVMCGVLIFLCLCFVSIMRYLLNNNEPQEKIELSDDDEIAQQLGDK